MIYYRVKSNNVNMFKPCPRHGYSVNNQTFIRGELYTAKELERLDIPAAIAALIFDTVSINKGATFTASGARFPKRNAVILPA